MKAIGSTRDHANPIVHALHDGVDIALFDIGQDSLFVFSDRSRQLDEGLELRATRPGRLLVQWVLR